MRLPKRSVGSAVTDSPHVCVLRRAMRRSGSSGAACPDNLSQIVRLLRGFERAFLCAKEMSKDSSERVSHIDRSANKEAPRRESDTGQKDRALWLGGGKSALIGGTRLRALATHPQRVSRQPVPAPQAKKFGRRVGENHKPSRIWLKIVATASTASTKTTAPANVSTSLFRRTAIAA